MEEARSDLRRLSSRRPFEARAPAEAVAGTIDRSDSPAFSDQPVEGPLQPIVHRLERAVEEQKVRPLPCRDGVEGAVISQLDGPSFAHPGITAGEARALQARPNCRQRDEA